MPLLTTFAGNDVTAYGFGRLSELPSDYELIQTITPSAVSTVTFSSIVSTYKHLQFRIVSNNGTGFSGLSLRFNGDTGSNYSRQALYADGSSVASLGQASQDRTLVGIAGSGTSNIFTPTLIEILDYTSTAKIKTVRSLTGNAQAGNQLVYLYSGGWYNTAAITSVTVFDNSGNNFASGSRISLYGIRG